MSSDPLPFAQVDRSVKQTAAILASYLNVSFQHAIGGLVQFWELNGDPRDLERLVAAGQDAVVLSCDEVARRFRLAMGKEMHPDELATLRLLERRADGYRVRGMSRYLDPIKKRIQARQAGVAGGKASAETRKKATPVLQSASNPLERPLERNPSEMAKPLPPACPDPQAPAQAESNQEDRGQRTEVISKEEEAPTSSPKLLKPKPDNPFATPEDFFCWAQHQRKALGHPTERVPRNLSTWWSTVGMEINGRYELLGPALERFGENAFWANKNPPWPFTAFIATWSDYVRPE